MRVSNIYSDVAETLGMPEDRVRRIYNSFWEFYKNTVSSIPFDDNLSEEYFKTHKTGFVAQGLGRFYCDYRRYKSIKKLLKNYYNAENNKGKADVQHCHNDG